MGEYLRRAGEGNGEIRLVESATRLLAVVDELPAAAADGRMDGGALEMSDLLARARSKVLPSLAASPERRPIPSSFTDGDCIFSPLAVFIEMSVFDAPSSSVTAAAALQHLSGEGKLL